MFSLIMTGNTKEFRKPLNPLSVMFRKYAWDATQTNTWKSIQTEKSYFHDRDFECHVANHGNIKTKHLSTRFINCGQLPPFSFEICTTVLNTAKADVCFGQSSQLFICCPLSFWKRKSKESTSAAHYFFQTNNKHWKRERAGWCVLVNIAQNS